MTIIVRHIIIKTLQQIKLESVHAKFLKIHTYIVQQKYDLIQFTIHLDKYSKLIHTDLALG